MTFNIRSSNASMQRSLKRWHEQYTMHERVTQFATQYYEDRLLWRSLNAWRLNLHSKLRKIKQAKIARRYLLVRHAWTKWRELVHVRQIEKKYRLLELAFVKRAFERK